MAFAYDASGKPLSLNYNGTRYIYATNIQGDVIAILNADGTAIVTYTYDAWGNPLSISGTMANTLGLDNPLRYRGYVWDQEIGLYYLQSRYYDPQLGRFINADGLVATGQGFIGNNMFSYCLNNPVSRIDDTGERSINLQEGIFSSEARCDGTSVGSVVLGLAVSVIITAARSNRTDAAALARVVANKQVKDEAKAESIAIAATTTTRKQMFFPANPLDFNPSGLIMKIYSPQGYGVNGGIIKWEIPGTKIAIFEWNEDRKNVSHYHAMNELWHNAHLDPTHYHAGDPVPEPWNTTFFGR